MLIKMRIIENTVYWRTSTSLGIIMTRKLLTPSAVALLAALGGPAALAQSAQLPTETTNPSQASSPNEPDRSARVLDLGTLQVLKRRESLTRARLEDDAERLRRVPGGYNLVDLSAPSGRNRTLDDALSFQPGLIVQEFFGGNDQPRINIRGSGIQSNPQARGVLLLKDGLPLNLADGSFVIGAFSSRVASHIVALRGANAFTHGGTTLGGAVNLISASGLQGNEGSLELGAGSFEERIGQVRYGGTRGNTDYWASLGWNEQGGFRDRNRGEQGLASLNLGRRFGENFESRLTVDATRVAFDIPGPLNRAQLRDDPRQVNRGIQPPPPGPPTGSISVGPNVVRDQPWRETDFLRVANRSTWLGDIGALIFGFSWQAGDDQFGSPNLVRDSDSNDLAAVLDWLPGIDVFGGQWTLGLRAQHGDIDRRYFANELGEVGREFARNDLRATNLTLFGQYERPLGERLRLTIGLQGVRATRDIEERFATPDNRPRFNAGPSAYTSFGAEAADFSRSYRALNPRLGLVAELDRNHQVFANISRSFEPPTFLELLQPTGGNPNQGPNDFGVAALDAQRAWTFELGTRRQQGPLRWELTGYWSRVTDELLTSEAFFGGVGVTSNSEAATIHRGVESGLEADLARALLVDDDRISAGLVYEWSDFFFDGGPFDGNRIAGVPRHRIQAELRYATDGGLWIAPALRWLPEDTPTDHANTIDQEAYALLSLRVGYRPPDGRWWVTLDARNLTDERYAASYLIREQVSDPAPPNAGPDQVTTFIPGVGRSATLTFGLKW